MQGHEGTLLFARTMWNGYRILGGEGTWSDEAGLFAELRRGWKEEQGAVWDPQGVEQGRRESATGWLGGWGAGPGQRLVTPLGGAWYPSQREAPLKQQRVRRSRRESQVQLHHIGSEMLDEAGGLWSWDGYTVQPTAQGATGVGAQLWLQSSGLLWARFYLWPLGHRAARKRRLNLNSRLFDLNPLFFFHLQTS